MQINSFEQVIQPRFSETDGLGHINNTVIPIWFEAAREPVFAIFNPALDLSAWNLIVAGFTIGFSAPTYYGKPVTVNTWISRVGSSSFEVLQRCFQEGKQTAEARTTLVHFDYSAHKSQPIPADIREQLERYLPE
jgi:acyl-CoA thioester hydrolase